MVRTGRGSTVKERGGATHYSYGEGSLTIHMVRVPSPKLRATFIVPLCYRNPSFKAIAQKE